MTGHDDDTDRHAPDPMLGATPGAEARTRPVPNGEAPGTTTTIPLPAGARRAASRRCSRRRGSRLRARARFCG